MLVPARVRSLLEHPRFPAVLAAAALLLTSPALIGGLVVDDFFLRITLLGHASSFGVDSTPNDLFRFLAGNRAHGVRMIHDALLPWVASPDIKLAFFRPVTSLTHRLDFALFPDVPALMHLHNLLWFALLAWLASRLYRRFGGPPWLVGLSAAFYALDEAHGTPVGWISNRNALVASVFVVLALLAHDRARRDGWKLGAVLSPLALAAALLSGEIAVGAAGYFAAYALTVDRAPWRGRLLALLPSLGVLLTWAAVYRALGYGAAHSSLYIDPIASPADYLRAAPERLLLLAAAQFGPLSSDFSMLNETLAARLGMVVVALAVVVPVVVGAGPLLRRDRVAAFWALGGLFALLPMGSTFANDRLLMVIGLGGAGLAGRIVGWAAGALDVASLDPPQRLGRWVATGLVVVLGVLGPLQLAPKTAMVKRLSTVVEPAHLPEHVAGSSLVVVNAPSLYHCIYLPVVLFSRTRERPAHMACLSGSETPVRLTRESDRVLALRPQRGFAAGTFDRLYRSADHRQPTGTELELDGWRLEVTDSTADGRPLAIRAHFPSPLEAEGRRFVVWTAEGVVPFTLPAVGETVTIPSVSISELMFGKW